MQMGVQGKTKPRVLVLLNGPMRLAANRMDSLHDVPKWKARHIQILEGGAIQNGCPSPIHDSEIEKFDSDGSMDELYEYLTQGMMT
jgi:hypothetical protein